MGLLKRLLLLSLVATAAFGETADVRVELTPVPPRLDPGATITWTATIENLGPDPAVHVEFLSEMAATTCVRQTITLAPGERRTRDCSAVVPAIYFSTILVAGNVAQYDTDPDPTNNVAIRSFDINTPPDLFASVDFGAAALDAGLPFSVRVGYGNHARTPATGATIAIEIPQATAIRDLPPNCTAEGTRVVCAAGTIGTDPPASRGSLTFTAVAPDASRAEVTATVTIDANEPDADPLTNLRTHAARTYLTHFVTNTNDEGPGSLRDAIVQNNIACTDREVWCKIAFRIPGEAAVHAIHPLSALPAVTGANTAVDATTQARYLADGNPEGPEIELNGENLAGDADGLTIRSCRIRVSGLAIHSFPDNGILVQSSECDAAPFLRSIDGNFIGTDVTGTRALPNERGVFIDGLAAEVVRNVISGNRRSGVYVRNGFGSDVFGNKIGLTRTLQPLGNGASGVYLAAGGGATDVIDNYIGFNAHFGVALDRAALQSAVGPNSFQANRGLAIDFGLDGPTPAIEEGFAGGPLRVPVITNAFYDAAKNETIIEGTAAHFATTIRVHVFANDAPDESGYGEGQYFLGTATALTDGSWRFVHPGRTPGPWIAATTSRYFIHGLRTPQPDDVGGGAETMTSELGRTVKVE